MPRKNTHVNNTLKITGGGIYCFFPYDRLDAHHKGCFKIGYAMSFNSRTEVYHTAFPLGVYFVAMLQNPRVRLTTQRTKKKAYIEIEKFVLKYMDDNGGQRIVSTTRVRNSTAEDDRGDTEFFYCNQSLIHNAFKAAHERYGGVLHPFNLRLLNKDARENAENLLYKGEITCTTENVR